MIKLNSLWKPFKPRHFAKSAMKQWTPVQKVKKMMHLREKLSKLRRHLIKSRMKQITTTLRAPGISFHTFLELEICQICCVNNCVLDVLHPSVHFYLYFQFILLKAANSQSSLNLSLSDIISEVLHYFKEQMLETIAETLFIKWQQDKLNNKQCILKLHFIEDMKYYFMKNENNLL